MEHPVATKLRTIVKYLETGTMLTKLTPCRVHRVYRYTNDLLAALVALGVPPTLAIFSKALGGTQTAAVLPTADGAGKASPELWKSLQELPPALAWTSMILILVFVSAKVYVIQANTEKKLALAESNRNQFRNFFDELETAILEKPDPMEDLNQLLGQIIQLKKLCVTNDIYPWSPFPPGDDFTNRCNQRSDELIRTFQDRWQPPPLDPGVRQKSLPKADGNEPPTPASATEKLPPPDAPKNERL